MRLFVLLFLLWSIMYATSSPASTPGNFLNGDQKGWFWYEKPPVTAKPSKPKPSTTITPPNLPFPPKTMEEARQSIKVLKERAIMNPTEHNLVSYIRLQNWITGRSQLFADVWQDTLRHHPELDYSIAHPTNAQALIVQNEVNRKQHAASIKKLGEDWGLFFIFRSDCPYCHKEAPMLKQFSEQYGMSIVPISQDGKGIPPYFPYPEIDKVSKRFGVQTVPALFLVHPQSHSVIPISFGLISEDALINRIITTTEKLQSRRAP